ncbi:MAG: TRAP transporter large permease subunit [Elioraea sp.]|nr:TRAP transporter large permease subunit [Elioraea sp.]
MDSVSLGFLSLAILLGLLGAGLWIFSALFLTGVAILSIGLEFPLDRIGHIMKAIMWRSSSTWEIAAIPMFILMGELIYRAEVSSLIFRGLAPFVEKLPGRLLHTNVLGSTLFAAVSGSSAATTATIGRITIGELARRGYDQSIAIGSLAGAGSLGLLIPPSIVMILYGILAEVSIARLFAAGLIPGLVVALLYSLWIASVAWARPQVAPPETSSRTVGAYLCALSDLAPITALIVIVLGGIYSGRVTPSEAAAIGVFATLVIVALLGRLSFRLLIDSLVGSVVLSAMICSILVAAAFLATAIGYAGLPSSLAAAIAALELSPYTLIAVLALFYLVLGFFLDGISITVMTLPMTFPLAVQAGWDPVWFGIFLVVMVEMAQITPPVGFNLFVLQGLTGWSINRIASAALPFFFLMCFALVLFTAFPGIVLFLPRLIW